MISTAVISSSSSHRVTSISCTTESLIAISLVTAGGTAGLRWAMCASSGAPIEPLVAATFRARYPAS